MTFTTNPIAEADYGVINPPYNTDPLGLNCTLQAKSSLQTVLVISHVETNPGPKINDAGNNTDGPHEVCVHINKSSVEGSVNIPDKYFLNFHIQSLDVNFLQTFQKSKIYVLS